MKRKNLILFGVLAVGLALAFFVFEARNASAQNLTLKDIMFPKNRSNVAAPQTDRATPVPQTGPTATVFPEGMVNPPTQESNWVMNSAEQMKKNAAVVESVSKLIEKTAKIYATAGWVHIAAKTEVAFLLSDTLPDGSPMPTTWRTDTWLLLDENGYLIRGVDIQDTGSSTTSQVSIFKDGVWSNITLGMAPDSTSPENNRSYRPLDHTILDQALMWKDFVVLEINDTSIGNENVLEYTVTSRSVKPYDLTGYDFSLTGSAFKYYLSKETGLVLKTEQYDITEDGQYKLIQRITTIVDEKIKEPPAEVLKYLE